MPSGGAIDVTVAPGSTRVVLSGEVDASLADDAQGAVFAAEASGQRVEVNLRDVTFMDCFGLRILMWLTDLRADVAVVDAPPPVRLLLEATGLTGLLAVETGEPLSGPPGVARAAA